MTRERISNKMLALWVVILSLVFIISSEAIRGSGFLGFSHDNPKTIKSYAALLIQNTSPFRSKVTSNILSRHTVLGSGGNLLQEQEPSIEGMDYIHVSDNGGITAYNEEHRVLIIFEPSFSLDKVVWSCSGWPITALPPQCK